MATESTVTMSIDRYNTMKQENIRCRLFLDNIMQSAQLSKDETELVFNNDTLNTAVKFCYADTYKKKMSYLKTAKRRYGSEEKERK